MIYMVFFGVILSELGWDTKIDQFKDKRMFELLFNRQPLTLLICHKFADANIITLEVVVNVPHRMQFPK